MRSCTALLSRHSLPAHSCRAPHMHAHRGPLLASMVMVCFRLAYLHHFRDLHDLHDLWDLQGIMQSMSWNMAGVLTSSCSTHTHQTHHTTTTQKHTNTNMHTNTPHIHHTHTHTTHTHTTLTPHTHHTHTHHTHTPQCSCVPPFTLAGDPRSQQQHIAMCCTLTQRAYESGEQVWRWMWLHALGCMCVDHMCVD